MINKLEGRLKEFGITKQKLAKLLNISPLDICEYFPREGRR